MNYSRATTFPIKQSHPEHKPGPVLKRAFSKLHKILARKAFLSNTAWKLAKQKEFCQY